MLTDLQRTFLRLGAVFILLAGLVSVVIAIRPPGSSRVEPIAVRAGETVELPPAGLFGRSLALYGNVPQDTDIRSAQLGCVMHTDDGGRTNPGYLSYLSINSSPAVVDGRTLQPVMQISRYDTGWTLRCDGPLVSAGQPMYLLSGHQRTRVVVRVVALGMAVVFFVVGAVGLVLLRPRRR